MLMSFCINTDYMVDLYHEKPKAAVSYITEIYKCDRMIVLAILLALRKCGTEKRAIGAYIMARLPSEVRNDLLLSLSFIQPHSESFYEIVEFGKPSSG